MASQIEYTIAECNFSRPCFTSLNALKQTNLSLYSVTAVILLDSAGNCVLSKYYDPLHPAALPSSEQKKATGPNAAGTTVPVPTAASANSAVANSLQGFANPFKTTKEQRAFEKGLFEKTRKGSGEWTTRARAPSGASQRHESIALAEASSGCSKAHIFWPNAPGPTILDSSCSSRRHMDLAY